MSYIVMNNYHLRKNILSYLRKEPKLRCYSCKKVLMWDNTVDAIFSYYNDNKIIDECKECYSSLSFYNNWYSVT